VVEDTSISAIGFPILSHQSVLNNELAAMFLLQGGDEVEELLNQPSSILT
jgi:hypothetical protein